MDSATFWAIAIPAAIFGGISKGGFGSLAAFAAGLILTLSVEPLMALAIILPVFMIVDLATLRPYWRRWSAPDSILLIVGGLPGVALGTWLFSIADAALIRIIIGSVALSFVVWQSAQHWGLAPKAMAPLHKGVGLLAGMASGFTSFVSHAGGPPTAVYLLSRGLTKTEFQATTVIVFWAINLAKSVPYAAMGLFTTQTLVVSLALAPAALLGAWIGVRAHNAIPANWFFRISSVLLLITGSKLIWDGLS